MKRGFAMRNAQQRLSAAILACILSAGLAACGGGGVASAPPPPNPPPGPGPDPAPAGSTLVELLDHPATQEFATLTNGDAGNQVRIRYDAATDRYDVMLPGRDWDRLVDDPNSDTGGAIDRNFVPQSRTGVGQALFRIFASPRDADAAFQYRYSNLAIWAVKEGPNGAPASSGTTALGIATPAGGVPLTGSATYQGYIQGSASIVAKSGWGDFNPAPVDGTVSLGFDFAQGTLSGQIKPQLACDCDPIAFPTLDFAQTVFGAGSQTFSGKFATGVSGENSFSGLFTGPHAEELIGRWTFPFLFNGSPESATGAWIAKRD